ncbi:hypothetical protein G6011_09985 [Alternaria panax]|uniref:Uncharacterized protein n=1 Tax=Alternaria panax TaxID=48097 RepID=A0AAD4FBB6_9PLEO|nr:hypothetical protein G6011_09985 [Alternaria panax]
MSLMDQLAAGGYKRGRKHLPDFAKRELVGESAATEALQAFPRSILRRVSDPYNLTYYVSWERLHDLTTAKVFHTGLTLHELFENVRLSITFDCLDEIDDNEGLERIGIPGSFNSRLERCLHALSALRNQKPRPVIFEFVDETKGVPSNMTHLFRSLSALFHELQHLGFDVRVTCSGWDMNQAKTLPWPLQRCLGMEPTRLGPDLNARKCPFRMGQHVGRRVRLQPKRGAVG